MAYTSIDDPSQYFQTLLYTGNASSRSLTNTGNSDLQPDWVWLKKRNEAQNHTVYDSTRGVSKILFPDEKDAEASSPSVLTAFDSDGFSLSADALGNDNSDTYASWQWKANGGTTTTNDASATSVGTIDSVYQANTTAGFSIVTYTGTGSNGTIAHGLGATPKWYFVKNRSESSVSSVDQSWVVFHTIMGQGAAMFLDTNDSKINHSPFWNSTAPTSTTFSVGTDTRTNTSSDNYIAYLFCEKQGYSKFGVYTGNGSNDGPFVYTGFKPAWVMYKRQSAAGNWRILDNKRDTFNVVGSEIYVDLNNAEADDDQMDFLSNGFKLRNGSSVGQNGDGSTYLYMAFAEYPFVSSKGVPVTAR